jgi:hypothetical protein
MNRYDPRLLSGSTVRLPDSTARLPGPSHNARFRPDSTARLPGPSRDAQARPDATVRLLGPGPRLDSTVHLPGPKFRLLGPQVRTPVREDRIPGADYGSTMRLSGPDVPAPEVSPFLEVETVRNPFLPPTELGQVLPPTEQGQASDSVLPPAFGALLGGPSRDSDVWSSDALPRRRFGPNSPSARIVFGSILVLASLGGVVFAAMYASVHGNDDANRATNAALETRPLPVTALSSPPAALRPEPAPAPSAAVEPGPATPLVVTADPLLAAPAAPPHVTAPHADVAAQAPARQTGVAGGPKVSASKPAAATQPAHPWVHGGAKPPAEGRAARSPTAKDTEDDDQPVSEDALLAAAASAAAEASTAFPTPAPSPSSTTTAGRAAPSVSCSNDSSSRPAPTSAPGSSAEAPRPAPTAAPIEDPYDTRR